MAEQTDRILAILRDCPNGLSAPEVADQLGLSAGNISSRLSKLAAYGIIRKKRGRLTVGVTVRSIYSALSSKSVE
jgi:DNA-binding transcriptional regulator GbsR (MarR family)